MALPQRFRPLARPARPTPAKLITTFPLERYEISTFGPRMPPEAATARRIHCDQAEPYSASEQADVVVP